MISRSNLNSFQKLMILKILKIDVQFVAFWSLCLKLSECKVKRAIEAKIKLFKTPIFNIFLTVPLCNFGTIKWQLTGNVTKGHIFVAKNLSIQYPSTFQQYWYNIRTSAWKHFFYQKRPKIEKSRDFFISIIFFGKTENTSNLTGHKINRKCIF